MTPFHAKLREAMIDAAFNAKPLPPMRASREHYAKSIDAAIAALTAHGFQIVPVEPTEQQLNRVIREDPVQAMRWWKRVLTAAKEEADG